MQYGEALAYLHGLQRFGMKPGLDRTRELLRRLGRPDRKAGRIIHITGTSGKGSVAALVEATLRAAGFRTGLYTSPALEHFTERIQVAGRPIGEDELAAVLTEVAPHVEAMVQEGHEQPTEFEVTTAAALVYFARLQVDWLVLEVGLGGRFDATTAADGAVITCITNIGLDHTDWLGVTHEEIAGDKAGIIRPAVPCVTGTRHPGALEVIRRTALENSAVLIEVAAEDYRVLEFGPGGQSVDLMGSRGWYRSVALSLLGRHQAENAGVALRVLELAGVPAAAIRAGFRWVSWPGRFELVRVPGCTVLLDAAHNPAKCAALSQSVQEYFPGRNLLLVLGVLADKQVVEMVAPLLELAGRVWLTTPESPRALPADRLHEVCASLGFPGADVEPDVAQALGAALEAAGPEDLVLVAGSFYTVGPARRLLRAKMGQE